MEFLTQLLALLRYAAVGFAVMLVLMVIVVGATSRVPASRMGRVLLPLALAELVLAIGTVWLYAGFVGSTGAALGWLWITVAAIVQLVLLVMLGLLTLIVTNR